MIFMCPIIVMSFRKVHVHLSCDTGSLGRGDFTWEVKPPTLPLHSQYICRKYIIEDRGEIPHLIAFYQQFLSAIAVFNFNVVKILMPDIF